MKSRFLNFRGDFHHLAVRGRVTAAVQRVPPRLLVLAFT